MMFKEKRLHPATVFFNLLHVLRQFALPIIIGFFTFQGKSLIYFLLALAALCIVIVIFSSISWYRFTYQVEDDQLKVEHGVLIRKKRFISKSRIQSIDLTASVFHRIFKLVTVKIETAGGGEEAEAVLKAVTLKEGELLREELKREKVANEETFHDENITNNPSDKISIGRLFIAGSTSGSIGVLLAILAGGFSQIEQFIPEHIYDDTFKWVISLSIILIVSLTFVSLVVLWVLGIAGTMIKYGDFTITKSDDDLFITRGLLEKKQLTIPLSRIQGVGIRESLIRQPMGYATVFVEVAGGSLDKGEDFSTVLFPILKVNEIESFLDKYLPEYKASQEELRPLPKRSMVYYLIRTCLPALVIMGGVLFVFPQFILIPVILLLVSFYLGYLKYKDGGFYLNGNRITVRFRGLSRTTMRMFNRRIQSLEVKQHKLHQIQGLATISFSILGMLGAGKHYTLKELDNKDATQIFDWYSNRKEPRTKLR